jgi:fructose-bisphosphate aldolase, class I
LGLGKKIRLNRLFSHPSGRLCSVAVDHFIGYGQGLPDGLRRLKPTLAGIAAAKPDAITMHKGTATALWAPYAGHIPLILQATLMCVEQDDFRTIVTPEEAVRLGADAIAIACYVRGKTEMAHLAAVALCVEEAARFDLPVICHIYPRCGEGSDAHISFDPEDIAWAAHCAAEMGVDVVKTPYCGDIRSYSQIVADCPVPLVAAGGPKAATLPAALEMMCEVIAAGACGATIGRNIWGFAQVTAAVHAFKTVIHDGASAAEALQRAGL